MRHIQTIAKMLTDSGWLCRIPKRITNQNRLSEAGPAILNQKLGSSENNPGFEENLGLQKTFDPELWMLPDPLASLG